jgi:hypothetical protein
MSRPGARNTFHYSRDLAKPPKNAQIDVKIEITVGRTKKTFMAVWWHLSFCFDKQNEI